MWLSGTSFPSVTFSAWNKKPTTAKLPTGRLRPDEKVFGSAPVPVREGTHSQRRSPDSGSRRHCGIKISPFKWITFVHDLRPRDLAESVEEASAHPTQVFDEIVDTISALRRVQGQITA
jgi:hypothetical protein